MNALARKGTQNGNEADEIQRLRDILDKSYAQFREQARQEWGRRCTEPDPSDACVHVQIRGDRQRTLERLKAFR
jgi:hypothetical protein